MSNGYGAPPTPTGEKIPTLADLVGATFTDANGFTGQLVAQTMQGGTVKYLLKGTTAGGGQTQRPVSAGATLINAATGTAYTTGAGYKIIDQRDLPKPEAPGGDWQPHPTIPGLLVRYGPNGEVVETRNAPSGAGPAGPAAPTGPGPFGGEAQPGQLLPTDKPGIYQFLNPNTGAIQILDLSVPDANLIAMIDPTTNAPVPGMFLDSSGKQVDLRPPNIRDPVGVANILISQYDSAIRAGTLTADDAWRRYQQQYDTANLQLQQWKSSEDIIQRRQETASARGETMRKMLSSSMPGLTGLKLPLVGQVPVTQFNPATYFDQFIPPGPPAVSTAPPVIPDFAPLPPVNLPPPPDLSKLLGV